LVIFFISFLIFLKISDSSFNLFFWNRVSKKTEYDHYHNKVVWLIGGSSGIGEDLAVRLSLFSPRLIISARRENELERVKSRCKKMNNACEVSILPMDMLKFDDLPAKVAEADKVFGKKVDIVVLNAGRSQRAEWTDIDPSVDIDCITINAVAPTQVARSILKHRGLHPTSQKIDNLQFVVISSVASLLPAVLSASYGAAKAALNQYFRLLAVEMGEKGVKVCIINPALVFAPNNPLTAFTSEKDKSHGQVIDHQTKSHMSPVRAAELISLSATHHIHESIISASPLILLLTYLNAIAPGLTMKLVLLRGVGRLRKLRNGEN
ncbi:hypothetical protein PFISCL1PPCAC_1562, partial [Pristionchus fissidentatus]